MMKFVYWLSRRQYGKVITPLKVFSARVPLSFGIFLSKLEKLEQRLRQVETDKNLPANRGVSDSVDVAPINEADVTLRRLVKEI